MATLRPADKEVAIALELVVEVLHARSDIGVACLRLRLSEGVVVVEADGGEVAPAGEGVGELDVDI